MAAIAGNPLFQAPRIRSPHERLEIVVRFLGILELFKFGLVDIVQARAFGDIELAWIGGDPELARTEMAIDGYEG